MGMNPLSPASWTVGGRRTTMPRICFSFDSAYTRSADRARASMGVPRNGSVSSVPRVPLGKLSVPDAMMSGLLVPARTSPIAPMAALSVAQAPSKSEKSWMKARWMTASLAWAPLCRLARSLRSPLWGWAPASVRAETEAGFRARPRTWWPFLSSSRTVAWPMKPAAPVTKTRMVGWEGGFDEMWKLNSLIAFGEWVFIKRPKEG